MNRGTLTWSAVAGLGMLAVAVGAAWAARRRLSGGRRALLAGAGAWNVAVTLKVVAFLALGDVEPALTAHLGPAWGRWGYLLYVGALTGVFEVGLIALLAIRPRLGAVAFGEATLFGVGFGAAEAATLGAACLASVALTVLAPGLLPPAAQAALKSFLGGAGPAEALWAPLERTSALVIHVVSILLVVAGRRARRPWLGFWAAFVYKSLVDTAAAWSMLEWQVPEVPAHQAALEVSLAVLALASLAALRPLRAALDRPAPPAGPAMAAA